LVLCVLTIPSASAFGAVLGFKNLGAEIPKWTCSLVIGFSYPIVSVRVKGSSDSKTEITSKPSSGRELGEQNRPSVDRSILSNFDQSDLAIEIDFPEKTVRHRHGREQRR